jgi:hypothetical protein
MASSTTPIAKHDVVKVKDGSLKSERQQELPAARSPPAPA